MSAITVLANYRDEVASDCYTSDIRGFTFICTPSHGYLVLDSSDNGYSDAIEIARLSNYSYILDGGLVYLEEDCDANQFLALNLDNRSL